MVALVWDTIVTLGCIFFSGLWLLLLYKGVRNGGPKHFHKSFFWAALGALAFFSLGLWSLIDDLEKPFGAVIQIGRPGRIREVHNFALIAANVSFMVCGAVLVFIFAWAYVRHLRQPKAEADQAPEPSLTPEEKQALLDQLESDALWQQGERAVATHMAACWEKVGLDDDWPTDQPLWERIDTQLHARYPSDDAQLAAYRAIQDRYLAIIRGEETDTRR